MKGKTNAFGSPEKKRPIKWTDVTLESTDTWLIRDSTSCQSCLRIVKPLFTTTSHPSEGKFDMPTNNKKSSQQYIPKSALRCRPRRRRTFKLVTLLLGLALVIGFLFNQNGEYVRASQTEQEHSPAQSDAIPIIDWPNDQVRPAIAYNKRANEYFVTWQHQLSADDDVWYIFGRSLDYTGAPAAPPLAISESDALSHIAPDITYQDGSQEYLVVWEYVWTETDHDIYARRLDGNGDVVGAEIPISIQENREGEPAVAANTTNGGYLVTWSQQIGSDDFGWSQIRGQKLNAAATPEGDLIKIGLSVYDQREPALAYDSRQNRYLVVWQEKNSKDDFDVMGQLVAGNGDLIGSAIVISGETADQIAPRVAYNRDARQYLVVWEDHSRDAEGAWDVRGQRVNEGGALVGARLPIAETYLYHRLNPDVTYKSEAGEYMVVWENEFQTDDHDIFQRRISSDGSFADSARAVSNSERFEAHPVIASDNAGAFVVAWEQDRHDEDKGVDIYDTLVQVSVTPTPDTPTPTPTHTPTLTHTPTPTPTLTLTLTPSPTRTSQPEPSVWLPMYLR